MVSEVMGSKGLYDIEQKILRIFINSWDLELTKPTLTHELFHKFDIELNENFASHVVLQDFLSKHPDLSKDDKLSILEYALEISGAASYYVNEYKEGRKGTIELSTEILANAISEYYNLTDKEFGELLKLKLLRVTKNGTVEPEPNLLLAFDLLQSLSEYFISQGLNFKVFNEFALGRKKFY